MRGKSKGFGGGRGSTSGKGGKIQGKTVDNADMLMVYSMIEHYL